jgi:hypothetical protein
MVIMTIPTKRAPRGDMLERLRRDLVGTGEFASPLK